MLQKQFRLPASVRLFHAKTLFTPYFTVKVAPNTDQGNRFGFIVSKKIDKRAVGRNRLKRRFRANIEQLKDGLIGNHDFLFLLKKEAVDQTTKDLHSEITRILSPWLKSSV